MAGDSAPSSNADNATVQKTFEQGEQAKKIAEKDAAAKEYAQKAEEARRKGKKPPKRRRKEDENLPKPTKKLQAREGSLELDKNLGKTMVVSGGVQRGPGAPGYYCDHCDRTLKDSIAYLDHLNSKSHLRKLGQSTKIHRSTLDQVRARIAQLREQTKEKTNAKAYDFEQRLKEIKDAEKAEKQSKREKRKQQKQAAAMEVDQPETAEGQAMAEMMGFSGFGTSSKR